ncbi:flagellar hook-length control protein FliK [Pseudomonas sp. AA-38]|uniref:flagellar hook-length control protein FliK n=1 Tax=Pseudomonas sp. AA-38 TaxID=3028807 RepID=UPI0023F9C79F|nr:flagellar hook-length control protein FliK [Pseudomonas sp. AA-38]
MPVMPEPLLQAAPEVKNRAKPPARAPEPSKNEPSSFDKVYAKERQTQAGERNVEARKSSDARAPSSKDEAEPAKASDAEQPEVAADGKTLPAEDESKETLDPLLAMALTGTAPQPSEEPLPTADAEGDALPTLLIDGTKEAKVSTDLTAQAAAESETDGETLDAMVRLQPQLEEQAKTQATVQPDTQAKAARTASSTDFAAAMASMGKQQAETSPEGEEPALEVGLEKSASDLLESLKESAQPNRPDQFVSKLSALTQAINQQSGVATRVPVVPGQPVAMNQGGWSEAVVDKVMWMSSQNLKSAEIQLDPADLGRLEVRVHMSQDAAQVTFASPNAAVRETLEGQMHRLRDMFAQQGMNLADANVSDQSLNRGWQGQAQGDERSGSRRGDGLMGGGDELISGVPQEIRSERTSMGRGLVDYYA